MEDLPNEVLLDIFSFLKSEDLLPCRLTSNRWYLLATEVLKLNPPIISLCTKMEAIYFLQFPTTFSSRAIFRRFRLALNKIPLNVIADLAQELYRKNIELTLFIQSETKTDIYQKVQVLLRNLQGLTFLKVESATKFPNLACKISISPQNSDLIFSSFQNLTKIVWTELDKALLSAIIQKARALRKLEVKHWFDSKGNVSLHAAPSIMKQLPSNAQLTTEIPSYCTRIPREVAYILKMCQFQNKISDLTLQPFLRDGQRTMLPSANWEETITQLLESQSLSLKVLDIQCEQVFIIPRLEKLEILKLREFAEVGQNLSCFPGLKIFAVRSDFLKNEVYGTKVWPTVRTLKLFWNQQAEAGSECILSKIEQNFPHLKRFMIHIQQLPELIRFCKNNSVPANSVPELCFNTSKIVLTSGEWNEILEVTSKLLSADFPSSRNQRERATLGLLGLTKLKICDADEGIQIFLDLASRSGFIKLDVLELILVGSHGFKTYKNILSEYHDLIVVKLSKYIKNEFQNGDDYAHSSS